MGSRASIIHTRLPSQPFLSSTTCYRARGPYRSWTVPLVDRTARGPYRSPTTRFASPYAIRASAGATDQIFTDPSSEHVAIECVSFGCHATQFTSSSCAPLHRADLSPLRGIVRRGSVTSEAVIAPAGGDDSARAPRHRDGGSIVP